MVTSLNVYNHRQLLVALNPRLDCHIHSTEMLSETPLRIQDNGKMATSTGRLTIKTLRRDHQENKIVKGKVGCYPSHLF